MAGYQMMVRGDILRGRYRDSFEHPEPFTPGEVTRVSFEIPAILQTFVNIYEAGEEDFQKATHRIYHDATRPSAVRVGILKE
jgi:predicted acyl esterase